MLDIAPERAFESGILVECCPECGKKPVELDIPESQDKVVTCCKWAVRGSALTVFDNWNKLVQQFQDLGKARTFTDKDIQENPSPLHRRTPFIEAYTKFGV